MLSIAIFCVLLIAAANVAGLLLARGAAREREIAIRFALGAGRSRIVRQLLAESLTVAAVSGLLGFFLASEAVRMIVAFAPMEIARLKEASVDIRVLIAGAGFCLLTAILVGLAPALTITGSNSGVALQESGRRMSGGAAATRIRRMLVAAEFSLAIMLLSGAGLLVRSLWSLENIDPGFRSERVLSLQLSGPASRAPTRWAISCQTMLDQVRAIPGVEATGIIGDLFVHGNGDQLITTEGETRTISERLLLRNDEISPGLFEVLKVPLRRGRFFSAADGPSSSPVAIINETLARRVWPGHDPVGRRFKFGAGNTVGPWLTVVGVVGDIRRQGLEIEPTPQVFVPLAQSPSRLVTLLVRTATDDPLKIADAVQAVVHRVEKQAPVYGITTLQERLGASLEQRRFQTGLLVGFSLAALLMASIGIYGLIDYSIATRTHEIGIRMAIGAQAGEIFRMIVREGLRLSTAGVIVGLAGALLLGRAATSLFYGVSAADPLTLFTVTLVLVFAAAAACCLPALRATKIEPVVALRHE
jgi:putative ABC transport system permease protein